MVHVSFMSLHLEKFQGTQDFRHQYMVLCKVCSELGLKLGCCK